MSSGTGDIACAFCFCASAGRGARLSVVNVTIA
jgi:hypothetical protein